MVIKNFYKIVYGKDLESPEIVPLDDDKIWQVQEGGVDKSMPFILINPGNLSWANKVKLPTLSDQEVRRGLCYQAKIFVKGVRKFGFHDKMQFLVAVNEDSGKVNIELIKEHNVNPVGFMTEYTTLSSPNGAALGGGWVRGADRL